MKVLLRSDVKGEGRRGDIVEVKSGYARNYLLPTGAALLANDAMKDQASMMRKSRDLRDQKDRLSAEAQRSVIEGLRLTIEQRASSNGRLFGSVTEADIVNAIRTAANISLNRHQIKMTEHLKEVGPATVEAELFDGVVATVQLEVVTK